MNSRFTAYISPEEREGIRQAALREGSSENYIVRIAIRQYLKLSARLLHVTNDTHAEGRKHV